MNKRTITAVPTGPQSANGLVSLHDLGELCERLDRCLKCADEIVRPDRPRMGFQVASLHCGSAVVHIEPCNAGEDETEAVSSFVCDTISRLANGRRPDRRLSHGGIETFLGLASLVGDNSDGNRLSVCGVPITSRHADHGRRLLGKGTKTIGRIRGRLETVNLHGKKTFGLFPAAGPMVACRFTNGLFEQVRKALCRIVTVSGVLYFRPGRTDPDEVAVDEIRVHPEPNRLPTLTSLRGIGRTSRKKPTAVETVRSLRDEEETH